MTQFANTSQKSTIPVAIPVTNNQQPINDDVNSTATLLFSGAAAVAAASAVFSVAPNATTNVAIMACGYAILNQEYITKSEAGLFWLGAAAAMGLMSDLNIAPDLVERLRPARVTRQIG